MCLGRPVSPRPWLSAPGDSPFVNRKRRGCNLKNSQASCAVSGALEKAYLPSRPPYQPCGSPSTSNVSTKVPPCDSPNRVWVQGVPFVTPEIDCTGLDVSTPNARPHESRMLSLARMFTTE